MIVRLGHILQLQCFCKLWMTTHTKTTLFSPMRQSFIYATKSGSTTTGYGVQRIPILFMNMREARLKWMSGVEWRGTQSLDMLQNFAIGQFPSGSIFQQDEALPHYRQVRDFLNENFPDMWIGRGGPLTWPTRSPNLTPLDFFFWGFVKNVVYQGDRPTTLEELRGHITNAAGLLTPQMLQNTWREVEYRLDVWKATQGAHIELQWPSSETRWVFISSYVKVYVNNPLFTLEIISYFSIPLAWTHCTYVTHWCSKTHFIHCWKRGYVLSLISCIRSCVLYWL